jgi:hypothetical protein
MVQVMKEPKPSACPYCDLSMGTRGMDRCRFCDGTGSVFWVKKRCFPNTKEGYDKAKALLNEEPL